MKSRKHYIHCLWMFLLISWGVQAQNSFNPWGYASSFKEALREPAAISTVSVYYNRGLIFDVEQGKQTEDAPVEQLVQLSNLKQIRLNGCPLKFHQEKFFASVSKIKNLESIELRFSFKRLGMLTEKSLDCLKRMKNLKRLNLPNAYPLEELEKLQLLLPRCEIITNLYPEGE